MILYNKNLNECINTKRMGLTCSSGKD